MIDANPPRWALITGASAGIGKAFAEQLAMQQYNLILVARRIDRLQTIASDIQVKANVEARAVACDLSDTNAVANLIASIAAEGLEIDLLFNNAGYGTKSAFTEIDVGRELAMIDVNCRSLVQLSHAFARSMRARHRGIIIHTSSILSFAPAPYTAVYAATKSFVLSFSEALREELQNTGVTVFTLCPGSTESEFANVAEIHGEVRSRHVVQTSEEVARFCIQNLTCARSPLIPGTFNQLVVRAMRWIPHKILLRLIGRVMSPYDNRQRTR